MNKKRSKEEIYTKIQKTVKAKNGVLLSKSIISAKTKIIIKCQNGHVWRPTYMSVEKGCWCPKCPRDYKKKYTISDMQKVARKKKGKCLSNEYMGMNTHLFWKCRCGNEFKTTPNKIIHRGQWCPKCGLKKRSMTQASTIEECQKVAKSRGGKCLSKTYKNNSTKIKWQCQCGYRWNAPLNHIKGSKNRKGTWCPKCNGSKKLNITYARGVAKELGWKCLSKNYINHNSKLLWKCNNGHKFEQPLGKVVARKSCPKCHIYYGEELCRFYFEEIFKSKFPKTRPDFLKTRDGVYLELDGYNEGFKLAFEHHGEQHYRYISKFHQSSSDLRKQQKVDLEKIKLCKRNDVKLIIVPAIPEFTKVEDIKRFLLKEFRKKRVKFNNSNIPDNIDYKYVSKNSRIELLKEIAKEKGGKLLSRTYLGGRAHLEWKCEKGHIWMATPENIIGNKNKEGTWCPDCARVKRGLKQRNTIEQMQKIARSKKGKCLSLSYVNSATKLKWQCHKGHTWQAVPSSIIQGSWCPYCSGHIVTIESLQRWAKKNGGECLSKRYFNQKTPLKWSCLRVGHQWKQTTITMQKRLAQSGWWCIDCLKEFKKNQFKSYEEAKETVKKLKLTSSKQWRKYCKGGNAPKGVPADPYSMYKNRGWKGWEDFLGY